MNALLIAMLLAPDFVLSQPREHRQPEDCLIVAATAYKRLQSARIWSEVVSMTAVDWQDGNKAKGHAMVVFQIADGANICVYDSSGGYPINTKSRKINDIKIAFDRLIRGADRGTVISMKVITPSRIDK